MTKLSYVKLIQSDKITISCEDEVRKALLKILNARSKIFSSNIWIIKCKNEKVFVNTLQKLNDEGFMFAGGPHGWNPVDTYILMRRKKLVTGKVMEIIWKGTNQIITSVL